MASAEHDSPHVSGASMNEIMFLNTHVSMSDEMGRLWHGRLPQDDLILGMPSPPSTSLVLWSSLALRKRNFIDVNDGPTVQTLGAAMRGSLHHVIIQIIFPHVRSSFSRHISRLLSYSAFQPLIRVKVRLWFPVKVSQKSALNDPCNSARSEFSCIVT